MPTGEITSNWETNFRFRHHKIQSWVPAASYCNSRSEIYVLTQNNIDKATVYFVIVQIADWFTNNSCRLEFAFKFFPNILLDSMFLYHALVHPLSIMFL